MRDLAPEIYRQRLVLEGLVAAPISGLHGLHGLHGSRFADVHRQVVHGQGVDGLDPRGCQPSAFHLDAS